MAEFINSVGHLEGIESPWANSGGVVRTIEDVEAMAKTGVGWIEDGSHTIESRLGNAVDPEDPGVGPVKKVYTHNPITGETGNSLGMPGQSMDVVEQEIPEKVRIAERHRKKYVLNVAPVSNEPVAETKELVRRGYSAGAHAVLVNAGCPNVVTEDGGRHLLLSRDPASLEQTLVGLRTIVEQFKPVFLRISPQEDRSQARLIFDVIRRSGVVSAVFTPNTWPGYIPLDENANPVLEVPGGVGGKSGPATADESLEQTRLAVEFLYGSSIDVVSSSGITNAFELKRRLDSHAVAGAGTTFYYESVDGWQEDTEHLLRDLTV